MRPNFYTHLHPPTIPAEQARWRYTLGAGGIAVFLTIITLLTGALELFYYVPTPENAAKSIQTLTYFVPFGALIRHLHFWSAQLLIIVAIIHLFRVVFTGAYAAHRHFNYQLGLALFLTLLLLDFTGYILRWDVGIQWALVVGVNLLKVIPFFGDFLYHALVGGADLGSATLIRFYGWHIFGLILPASIFLVWHIFRLRRDGGIARPPRNLRADSKRIRNVDLVRREVLAMLLVGALLIFLAILFPAPIAPPIDKLTAISGDPRAPWFFLWVQKMLQWGDPLLWGILIPTIFLAIFILIPYIFPKPADEELGRWFPKSNKVVRVVVSVIFLVVFVLSVLK